MAEFPTEEEVSNVRDACLVLRAALGDLWGDLVVVGGMVPTLLYEAGVIVEVHEPHKGSRDLDIVLSLAVVESDLYKGIRDRLAKAGFRVDHKENGNDTPATWILEAPGMPRVSVDFIVQAETGDVATGTKYLAPDLAAFKMAEVELAFVSPAKYKVKGTIPNFGYTEGEISVCAPGPFIILKLLAHRSRGLDPVKNGKDAYDIFFIMKNVEIDDLVPAIAALPQERITNALEVLCTDFARGDGSGPTMLARYLGRDGEHVDEKADLVGGSLEILRRLGKDCAGQ
jgi:hypothetical protein